MASNRQLRRPQTLVAISGYNAGSPFCLGWVEGWAPQTNQAPTLPWTFKGLRTRVIV